MGVLALSIGDALLKASADAAGLLLGPWQVLVLRSALVLAALLALSPWLGGLRTGRAEAGWVLVRGLLLGLHYACYYVGLAALPFGVAASIYYTLPLFVVLFAMLFGGERGGAARWVAVALGFAGALLVIRPGSAGFGREALWPLAAAVLFGLAMVVTRTKCRQAPTGVVAGGLMAMCLVVGLIGAGFAAALPGESYPRRAWIELDARGWLVIAGLALAMLVASLGTAFAYQHAPASVAGVFDFAYVGFALVWGIAFFDERPQPLALLGIALIVGAGTLALRSGRAQPPPG